LEGRWWVVAALDKSCAEAEKRSGPWPTFQQEKTLNKSSAEAYK